VPPGVVVDQVDRPAPGHPGGVEHPVEPPAPEHRRLADGGVDRLGVAHVDGPEHPAVHRRRLGRRHQVAPDDAGPLGQQPFGGGPADAGCGAGHEHGVVGESSPG
jgi:hypothetical protein